MKLEVGQFIRTPYGIRKIVDITKDEGYGKPRVRVIKLDDFLNTGYKFNYEFYTDEKIIKECKASYNITDILEVGDIISFYEDIDNYKKQYVIGIPGLITLDEIKDKITNDNIRLVSILTPEEMEQMAYKVGD